MHRPLEEDLARLDRAIHPIASRPVDLDELDSVAERPSPLDEAGVRTEAQAMLLDVLRMLAVANEEERRGLRGLVSRYPSFFWAAYPPEAIDSVETLRRQLLHFALVDQYPDARDAILWLNGLLESPDVPVDRLASLLREVAAIASDDDRYGFGSTRSWLLSSYEGRDGTRGGSAPA